jgi:hypothetical protein
MSAPQNPGALALPNGLGAAAILAAAASKLLNFYNPTGSLSGVTTIAIVVWLAVWFLLARAWEKQDVNLRTVSVVSFVLLAVGFLLTFPPFMDLLQGK